MSKAHKNSTTKNTRRLNPYPPISTKTAMTSPTSPSGNRSAGPWNAADDAQLKKARHQGMNWQPIATQFFPTKSANACRKRHERLMDKAQSTEAWDQSKVEHMARIYCELRETMWTMIASKMNESWKVVEAKCMEKGVKTLQSAGRRHDKSDNTGENSGNEENFDDSGLGLDSDRQFLQDPHSASDVGPPSHSSRRTYSNASSYAPTPHIQHAPSPSPQHLHYPHQYPQVQGQWPSSLIQQQQQQAQQQAQHQAQQPYQLGTKLPSIQDVLVSTGASMRNTVTTAN